MAAGAPSLPGRSSHSIEPVALSAVSTWTSRFVTRCREPAEGPVTPASLACCRKAAMASLTAQGLSGHFEGAVLGERGVRVPHALGTVRGAAELHGQAAQCGLVHELPQQ
jgi:hypothetical protein